MTELSSGDGAFVDPASYVHQFKAVIERIDRHVFEKHGAHISATVLQEPFPGLECSGRHIQRVVTYRAVRPVYPLARDLSVTNYIESYLIWGREVESLADKKVIRKGAPCGDADFHRMLTACAIMLVRHRVLEHPQFFPNLALRTLTSTYYDQSVPEVHRCRLFQKKAQIPSAILSDRILLDGYLLLILAGMVEEDGHPVDDALHYLTNS